MKQKKYIVTGGAGFIGSHIVHDLLRKGHKILVVDNLDTGYLSYLPDHENLEFLKCDVSHWSELSKHFFSFEGADGVFHLAACARIQPSIKDPSLTNNYNVTGTMNVLQMMRMCNIKSIVYSGSSSFYGNGAPIPCKEENSGNCETPYAVTKHMGELYCQTWGRLFGIRNVVLRYFNVYGKRSPLSGLYAPVIGLFFKQALTGNDITIVGDGEQKRDFTHVNDVVEANVTSMELLGSPARSEINGEVFNIGTGKNYTIKEIAHMVADSVMKNGIEPNITFIPARQGESRETLADYSKAKQLLGWEPMVDLDDGVSDLKNYFLNNVDKIKEGKFNF